jgi:hypothetical protein
MRITLDTTAFNTLLPATQANIANTTNANIAFILRTMNVAANFYMKRLKVGQTSNIAAPVVCVDFNTPGPDQTNGVSLTDLHIYLTYLTDSSKSYGATGKSCKYYGDGNTNLPDTTLQAGRPTMGRIIFNTYVLVDGQSLTNRLFQSCTATALH